MARRATLKDVAERAQVSTATVSYVLNDKKSISEQTKGGVLFCPPDGVAREHDS